MARSLRYRATIQRHHAGLPRYVTVPGSAVAPWRLQATTVVEGTIAGHPLGRRSLKRLDDKDWFIDLPERLCRAAGVDIGDAVVLEVQRASEELPVELREVLETNPAARACWARLTESQQRMLREHVAAAKQGATRKRRARRGLLG